jgi:hypothetical protein
MLNDIIASVSDAGFFNLWKGVQPADVSSATTAANTTVAILTWATKAFVTSTTFTLTANAITSDSSAIGGSANWFSITNSAGTRMFDGEVGTSGADLNLNSVAITTGATVAISAFTVVMAN